MKMVKYECSLCHFTKTFQSKRAWKNHLIMEHTAEREGKLMWRCSFCHNLFRGYPRERNFYVHQYQRCFFAPPVKLDLQTGKIEDPLDIPGLGITKINRLIDLRNDRILTLEILLTPRSLGGVGISFRTFENWDKQGWTKTLHINERSLHERWRKSSKNSNNIRKAVKRKYYKKKTYQ